MFTGDRSGEWLYRALHDAGFSNQSQSVDRDDGLTLTNAWVTAPVRCAPPANRPSTKERDNCAHWFDAELSLLGRARVFVCLGRYGYHATWRHLSDMGAELPRPRPKFGHGAEVGLADGRTLLMSFHPSQQNTFTGKLTREMFDAVFARAQRISAGRRPGP
jgi:uracil-DNA glycosylase family 4